MRHSALHVTTRDDATYPSTFFDISVYANHATTRLTKCFTTLTRPGADERLPQVTNQSAVFRYFSGGSSWRSKLFCLRFSAKKSWRKLFQEKKIHQTSNCFQSEWKRGGEETLSLLPHSDTTLMKNANIAFKALRLCHSLSLSLD